MKKKFVLGFFALLLVFALVGCTNKTDTGQAGSSPGTGSGSGSAAGTGETVGVEGYRYENTNMGYAFNLPAEWENNITAKQEAASDYQNAPVTRFYYKTLAGGEEILASVYAIPVAAWQSLKTAGNKLTTTGVVLNEEGDTVYVMEKADTSKWTTENKSFLDKIKDFWDNPKASFEMLK